MTSHINKDIFRAYDIRGQIGTEWCIDDSYDDAYAIGQAIGGQLVKRGSPEVIIGRDGRVSSALIRESLIYGLTSVGCNVTDIGLTATPVVYFALTHLNISNSVMITGSHNPPDHNGIKIVFEETPITALVIETLYFDIMRDEFDTSTQGKYVSLENINQEYQKAITQNINLKRPLRIAIDAGNGATSLIAESLFTQLGCEVHPLFCELDSTFPNHSPDPTVPENLNDLISLVKKEKLDIGIAFDGDGDRMIAVDSNGKLLWPDRIMILLAQEVLKAQPSACIVYDVKCSYLLPKAISKAGGQASMCVSGHSILKIQMKRLNASMGGEFSGHIVMPDRWNDFDDGPYVAARLLEILSNTSQSSAAIFNKIPDSISTPEYKFHMNSHEEANDLVEEFIKQASFSGANLTLIDGLRVDYEDGWGLVRSSNTSACLGFRFEAVSESRLEEIQQEFREVFDQLENAKALPF
ncbi:MAG: phosphomannomutase/phosphoglucomutase [Cocleimonas sp.]|nr:phosphomannomutase/phosphoglucomutase [Cocleimonas sp.]